MHTISSLRKTLGLTTTNQVRNRIEAVRDLLDPYLRRGPNNQILLSDEGLSLLRQFQELVDSGLRLTEASAVLQVKSLPNHSSAISVSPSSSSRQAVQGETEARALLELRREVEQLRRRIHDLETDLAALRRGNAAPPPAAKPLWWAELREGVDVT